LIINDNLSIKIIWQTQIIAQIILNVLLVIQKLEILLRALLQLNTIVYLDLSYVTILKFCQTYLKVFLKIRLQVFIFKVDSEHEIFVDL
jgi:hypothetical protein